MWINVDINGEHASTTPFPSNGEEYADVFEVAKVENADRGRVTCLECNETFDSVEDAEETQCPDDTSAGHAVVDQPLTWFDSARVRLDEGSEAVHVEIVTDQCTFQMTLIKVPDDATTNAGALVLHVPDSHANLVPLNPSASYGPRIVVNP